MKRTILRLSDFEEQAAAILAASRAKRGDGLRMEQVDNDEDDPDESDEEDEEEDEEDPDDDADESGDDDSDDSEDDDKSKDKKDKKKKKSDESEDKVDRAEYERVKRHRAAADRKNAELQRQIDDLKKGDKKDDKKDEKPGPSEREAQLEKETQNLRIQNAFLAANQYNWVDPSDALRLADLSDVEIEDDGTVVGLKEALQTLAKEKPHLLVRKVEDPPKKKSGSATGKRKGGTTKVDRATLSKTYPVLANRR